MIKIIENNNKEKPDKSKLRKKDNSIKLLNLDNFFFYKFHIKFNENIYKLIDEKVFWTHNTHHKGFEDDWNKWIKLWKDYHFLPIAFHIRDAIRHLESNRDKRHKIFGKPGKGSKVYVSHGYEIDNKTVEIRIWGYDVEVDIKNKIMTELESKIKEKLFSSEEYNDNLESCILKEEKTGGEILEGLK